jgi:hypothetical protein
MKFTAFIESDSFQMGLLSGDCVPQWDEETLAAGITSLDTGMLIATYPDLDNRKRSILVTVMDKGEHLNAKEKHEFVELGVFTLKAPRKVLDIGCVPSICGGTSGRVTLDKKSFRVRIYGDSPHEPKKLLIQFLGTAIVGVDADRLRV